MKIPFPSLLLAGLTAAGLLLAGGCGGGSSKTKMDTADFSKAFATADAALKTSADEAAKALNSGKLFEGTTELVNLAKANVEKLSDDQKNALINLSATIQMVMSEDGDKADLKVYQAVEDLIAALDSRESTRVGLTPDRTTAPKAVAK